MTEQAISAEALPELLEVLKALLAGQGVEVLDDDVHILTQRDEDLGRLRVMLSLGGPQGVDWQKPAVKLEIRRDPALLGIGNKLMDARGPKPEAP